MTALKKQRWTSKSPKSGPRAFRFRSEIGQIVHEAEVSEDRNQLWASMLTDTVEFRASLDKNISTFQVLPELDGILTVGEKEFLR